MSAFDLATAIDGGGGQYTARLDPAWDGPLAPNGGVIAAILLRAAQAELARPELPPRTVTVHYLRPATHGPAQLSVEVLRAGRQNATVQVGFHQRDRLVCTALITFSAARPDTLVIAETAPDAPMPEQVEELQPRAVEGAPPALHRLRLRPCFGARPLTGAAEAITGGWFSLRDDGTGQPYDAVRLVALTDLWWPAVFPAIRAFVGAPTLELTIHLRSTETVQAPILGRFETRTIREGHLDESGQLWSQSGHLLAESRQIALLIDSPAPHEQQGGSRSEERLVSRTP